MRKYLYDTPSERLQRRMYEVMEIQHNVDRATLALAAVSVYIISFLVGISFVWR